MDEWRFFLMQHVGLGDSQGLEIIGYDEESKSFKSHYFGSTNTILEYVYSLKDDRLTVSIDMPGRKGQFIATFSDDGNSFTGRWDWMQDGVPMGYDATMTRII